ncbi:hypothetical protein LTR41_008715 [Exophiala xenobiotica]|nr:hypothetical protein LTR41_008715 [Exophiala xenobiotica]
MAPQKRKLKDDAANQRKRQNASQIIPLQEPQEPGPEAGSLAEMPTRRESHTVAGGALARRDNTDNRGELGTDGQNQLETPAGRCKPFDPVPITDSSAGRMTGQDLVTRIMVVHKTNHSIQPKAKVPARNNPTVENPPVSASESPRLLKASDAGPAEVSVSVLKELCGDNEQYEILRNALGTTLHGPCEVVNINAAKGKADTSCMDDDDGEERSAPTYYGTDGAEYESYVGLDSTEPPLHDIHEIFDHIAQKAKKKGIADACHPFKDVDLRLFTLCSGTDAPVVAMTLIKQALKLLDVKGFNFQHVGSCEIEPQKQAFIERNFKPPVLFRDVTEFTTHSKNPSDDSFLPRTAYGAPAKPPPNVHLLVAGASCVDFSALRIKEGQPKFDPSGRKGGESSQTFAGVFNYAKVYRPNVILLENVITADWNNASVAFLAIDYHCKVVKIDTVNYYLPQTRNRAYCLLIDRKHADQVGLDCKKAADDWAWYMAFFQYRASSPYTEFMLSESDPRLLFEKKKNYSLAKSVSTTGWVACRKRHNTVRINGRLGNHTPYSQMIDNPPCRLDDAAWQEWAIGQSARVVELLDINYLRYASERDFDMRYKHRNINISQNVDRDTDRRKWGIVGCVTPKGSLFETLRGRPLIGLEMFALQGMPISDLSLNKESSGLLQDLAGNAMTTTVIGTAILSALLACHQGKTSLFQEYVDEVGGGKTAPNTLQKTVPASRSIKQLKDEVQKGTLQKIPRPKWHSSNRSPKALADAAFHSLPLCGCEGVDQHTTAALKFCRRCLYTCCIQCSRREHDGLKPLIAIDRRPACEFIQHLTESLPAELAFCVMEDLPVFSFGKHMSSDKNACREAKERIVASMHGAVRFGEVVFNHTWKAVYESDDAILELEFVLKPRPDNGHDNDHVMPWLTTQPTWRLFAKPKHNEPSQSMVRNLLKHHIAEMLVEKDLCTGIWKVWKGPIEQEVKIGGSGETAPSWKNRLGLEKKPFVGEHIFTELNIELQPKPNEHSMVVSEPIFGKYELLPKCPAASETLHKKFGSSAEGYPIYAFLKPDPLQGAEVDCVVLSKSSPQQGIQDDRSILAKFTRSWGPPCGKGPDFISDEQVVQCELFTEWTELRSLEMTPSNVDGMVMKWVPVNFPADMTRLVCKDAASTVLTLQAPLDAKHQKQWPKGHRHSIEIENAPGALEAFASSLPYATDVVHADGKWKKISVVKNWKCRTCLPELPALKWVLKKQVLKAIEDAEQAAQYEQELKNRPKPAIATLYSLGDFALVDVGINIKTLTHRAVSQLHTDPDLVEVAGVAEWRIVRQDRFASYPTFGPIEILSNDDTEPIDKRDFGKRRLWDSQRRVLTWMRSQEETPKTWEELSLVECRLPSLGWNVESRAFSEKVVRGGVIGDNVGSGKTLTSLTHVGLDYERIQAKKAFSVECPHGLIQTDATIILMPKNIKDQWEEELQNCLPSWTRMKSSDSRPKRPYYIVIKLAKELPNYTVEDIRSAAMIFVPFDIFEEDKYWDLLQKLACAPHSPSTPGRAFSQWLTQALSGLKYIVQKLPSEEKQAWKHWEDLRKQTSKYHRFHETMNRKTQKAKRNQDPVAPDDDDDNANATSKQLLPEFEQKLRDFREAGKIAPLLHMFHFRRVMVDEFTYVYGKTLLGLLNLSASAKWLLSGTPPIHDYDDVNTMAKLLNTRVSTHNERDGKFGFGKDRAIMRRERSDAQDFRAFKNVESAAYKDAVYDHAKTFLKMFIRKNQPSVHIPEARKEDRRFTLPPSELLALGTVNKLLEVEACKFNRSGDQTKKAQEAAQTFEDELKVAIGMTNTPAAARLCAPSFVHQILNIDKHSELQYEEDAVSALTQRLATSIMENAFEILKALQELWYIERTHKTTEMFVRFVKDVTAGNSDTPDLLPMLKSFLQYAKDNAMEPSSGPSWDQTTVDSDGEIADKKGLTQAEKDKKLKIAVDKATDSRVVVMTDLILKLSQEVMRFRFFKVVSSVIKSELAPCTTCGQPISDLGQALITDCGHIVACQSCCPTGDLSQVKRCCTSISAGNTEPASRFKLSLDAKTQPVDDKVKGSMARCAMSIIQDEFGPGESGVVFAQFRSIKDSFVQACKEMGIECFDGWTYVERQVKNFKKAAKTGTAVLVLQTDSAEAAGHNLQIASHVLFLGPVLVESVSERETILEQAVGRCLRPGQVKTVQVYHLGPEEEEAS